MAVRAMSAMPRAMTFSTDWTRLFPTQSAAEARAKQELQAHGKKQAQSAAESVLTSGSMGLLTGPHQMSFSDDGSLTTRLSRGDRPVFLPE